MSNDLSWKQDGSTWRAEGIGGIVLYVEERFGIMHAFTREPKGIEFYAPCENVDFGKKFCEFFHNAVSAAIEAAKNEVLAGVVETLRIMSMEKNDAHDTAIGDIPRHYATGGVMALDQARHRIAELLTFSDFTFLNAPRCHGTGLEPENNLNTAAQRVEKLMQRWCPFCNAIKQAIYVAQPSAGSGPMRFVCIDCKTNLDASPSNSGVRYEWVNIFQNKHSGEVECNGVWQTWAQAAAVNIPPRKHIATVPITYKVGDGVESAPMEPTRATEAVFPKTGVDSPIREAFEQYMHSLSVDTSKIPESERWGNRIYVHDHVHIACEAFYKGVAFIIGVSGITG